MNEPLPPGNIDQIVMDIGELARSDLPGNPIARAALAAARAFYENSTEEHKTPEEVRKHAAIAIGINMILAAGTADADSRRAAKGFVKRLKEVRVTTTVPNTTETGEADGD